MNINAEPEGAFPYKKPTLEIKEKYKHLFQENIKISDSYLKLIFDKILSSLLLLFALPILMLLKILYYLEGILISENKGNLFFYYYAVSKGRKFKKYKIRIIKEKFIDKDLAKKGEWMAYSNEWKADARTFMGTFVKKYYLDEIPQIWNIFIGDMSFVGPRPLSVMHYTRDLSQGNVTRKIIKGGLLGLGHIMKGTKSFGDPTYEYIYANHCYRNEAISLLLLDIKILFKGLWLVLKGGGH